ncbi:endonuclease/exonuclease/phosphatase family protein [Streptomyces cavernae]|uniref:endonuclease/exonuclease/phosphatase family protein n=1 Tax=Streptomyces cavernae TaxID=2259034 RepID=UPI000FEBF6A9|nr:endonuclease/exonuclease/phosphatase family protein [Streptomyces cavernae]
MRLATFNVLHGRTLRDGRPLPAPSEAPERPLAEAVASLDADVLALQELDRLQERSGNVDQARIAAEAAGVRDWRYASAFHGRAVPDRGWVLDPAEPGLRVYGPEDAGPAHAAPGVPSHGIALISRLPVRQWRARRFSAAPLGLPLRVAGRPGLTVVRDQPRPVLAAVLDGPRGPFTAVALHLSFVPGWNAGQLLALRGWLAGLPRPQVLLGDFNLVGALPRTVLNAAGTTGSGNGTGTGRGWRDLARVPTFPAHRPRVQFDHVLVDGAFRCGEVVGVRAPRTPVSDHRPLVVELPA